jgi:hypothetical protein
MKIKEIQSVIISAIESLTENQLNIDNDLLFPIINIPQIQVEKKQIDVKEYIDNYLIADSYCFEIWELIDVSIRGMNIHDYKFKNTYKFLNILLNKIDSNKIFDNLKNRTCIYNFIFFIILITHYGELLMDTKKGRTKKLLNILSKEYEEFQKLKFGKVILNFEDHIYGYKDSIITINSLYFNYPEKNKIDFNEMLILLNCKYADNIRLLALKTKDKKKWNNRFWIFMGKNLDIIKNRVAWISGIIRDYISELIKLTYI